uniref:Uncharacterized protein n=2 Tax=Physcomitrium patens TaxID=3218 RepID=A0A7I4F1J6_PHYPA
MLVIYCSKEVLSVCLSAVVAGLEEVAGWIGECPAEFRALSRRSVLLVWHFCTCCGLHSLFIEQGDRMNWRLKLRKTERGGNPDSLWNELEYDSPNRKQRKILRAGNALKSKNRSRRAL